ncbi:hypothetical protein BD769DRAFT_1782469 [Suillus cothurnatus]|nr:hypothetical protein BD769DRAFT_1782469 [Suillus cothurnatus]
MHWTISHQSHHSVRWQSTALQHSLSSQVLGSLVQIPRPHYVHNHSGRIPPRSSTLGRSSGRPRPVLIFSAKYHFRCSVPIYMHPSSMDPNPAYHANTPFVANVNCTHPNLREPNCSRNRLSTPLNLLGQDSPQSHEDKMQSQLYKQCVPGVNLGNFSLGNSLINNYDSSTATSKEIIAHSSFSSFPKDIRNYIM